jgi:Zn-dependent protease
VIEVIFSIIGIIVLIISVILHEYAHGRLSFAFGDSTPKDEGRLTLNPIKHLDPVGSLLLPLFLIILNSGFIIGWAKPVPINPNNYQNKKLQWTIVALAGPLTNYLISFISFLIIISLNSLPMSNSVILLKIIIWYFFAINFVLASFNLIPLPPLDGFWLVYNLLPEVIQDKISVVLDQRYIPLMIILTATVAVLISKYTILPAINFFFDLLKIANI